MKKMNNQEEIWHHCEVPFTRYEVSNKGSVRNAHTGMKKRPFLDKYGYHLVNLYYKGGHKNQYVHRLVALAFVPGWRKEFEVNHKNGVKTDNRAENLEWVTHRENCRHGVDVLLKTVKPVALFDEQGHLQRIYPSSHACNRMWGRCVRSAISTQNRYRGFKPLYISVPMYREIVHLVNVHSYTLQSAFIEASLNLNPPPAPLLTTPSYGHPSYKQEGASRGQATNVVPSSGATGAFRAAISMAAAPQRGANPPFATEGEG